MMRIQDEGRSNAAHWHAEFKKAEAKLAERQAEIERLNARIEWLRSCFDSALGVNTKHDQTKGGVDG